MAMELAGEVCRRLQLVGLLEPNRRPAECVDLLVGRREPLLGGVDRGEGGQAGVAGRAR